MNDSQLTVELGQRSYPVLFRTDATSELVARLRSLAGDARVLIVADATVDDLHGEGLRAAAAEVGLRAVTLRVPAGEAAKSIAVATDLWDRALGAGIDRRTHIVAFGGGAVGDLAGFVASTLMRGLPWVHVPTTLMAQVDASVGGKTALNHPAGKNLIGTFHQPRLVFADTCYLETLPARDIRAGLAEVVKHACLAAPPLLDALRTPDVLAGSPVALRPIVRAAVAIKAEIVSADETEGGPRILLNLGHTLGHALEAAAGFGEVRHGEAVSLGLAAAVDLSLARLGLPSQDAARILETLAALGLPTDWRPLWTPALLPFIARDKKARGDRARLVLLHRLGEPAVVPISLIDLEGALSALALSHTRETP